MMAIPNSGAEFPLVPVGGRIEVHYEEGGRTTLVFSDAKCTVYHFCRFCGHNYSSARKVDACEDAHRQDLERRQDELERRSPRP